MRRILAMLMLATGTAQADVPVVVTDIAPVHSLTALVMDGVGAPQLLLDQFTDPHHVQLRPSQARLMGGADLVIWTGEALTPWLSDVIDTLGAKAGTLELLALGDLPLRIEDDGALDPHAWLNPQNAIRFLGAIASALSQTDAEHAATYRANAQVAATRIRALDARIADQLASLKRTTLLPYHDAYRYFFIRYNLRLSGSLAPIDGSSPGAAHIAEVRSLLAGSERVCVFSEPGANPKLIATVLTDPDQPITSLNPLGSTLPPGPMLYENLMANLSNTIAACGP